MNHQRRVLLVEDNAGTEGDIRRWLRDKYHVEVARNLEEAKTCLLNKHYHVAIVDISLVEDDEWNKDGYRLMEWMTTQPILEGLLCIVITAHHRGDLAINGYGRLPIACWIVKRPSYRQELTTKLTNTFCESVRVNFELVYDGDSEERLWPMAGHVEWPEGADKPNMPMLVDEIRDLIGKHFREASSVHLKELTKGLSGAAVVRVRAMWDNDYGPSYVLKISRRDKVQTEFHNYSTFVARHLPPNTAVNAQVVYAGHLGAIQYNFAEDANKPLDEFDTFFQRESAEQVKLALQSLFRETCHFWYSSPKPKITNLIALYYEALNLNEDKLTSRIRRFVPELDPTAPRLYLPGESTDLSNPLFWLRRNYEQCEVRVCFSINHGDLTGRNVFVNDQGHCWLIDFFRTGRSQMLRDHAILETDIKYRLLPELFQKMGRPEAYSQAEYERMELALRNGQLSNDEALLPEVHKATAAVLTIRQLADELMARHHHDDDNIKRQILISRLITTLNVTRLRHVDTRHKLWALATAGRIREELDQLPPPR